MFVDRLIFCLIAAFLGEQTYCSYLLLGWVTLYIIFLAATRPYAKKSDYLRGLGTQSAAIIVMVLYCVLVSISDQASDVSSRIIPVAVLIVLLLNLLMNVTLIGIGIKDRLATKKEGKEQ